MPFYILQDRKPVIVTDPETFARFMADMEARRVELTKIDDSIEVSTVFLGIDHNHSGSGPPVLFETMVFGGPYDDTQDRYCTWEEAESGHAKWVAKALAYVTPKTWAARLVEDDVI